jgi:hypothetical protein
MTFLRRASALALLLATAAAAPALEGVSTLAPAQVAGSEAHPGDPALPWGRPAGEILSRSRVEAGVQVIDLRPAATGGGADLIIMVNPGTRARELRVVAVDPKGKRKELGRAALKPEAWQDSTVAIPEGLDLDHLQLVSAGVDAFWLAGAALHAGGDAHLVDLAVIPDPLLALGYDGSQGVVQIARTLASAPLPGSALRVLLPGSGSAEEKAASDRLVGSCVAGWNTAPPPRPAKPDSGKAAARTVDSAPGKPITAAADSRRWYATSAAFPAAADAALADLPQLLVIDLATVRSPVVKPDAIAKLMTQSSRAGVILALVVEERPDDSKLVREWKKWIEVMHQAAPALGIIDLQEVHDWYARPGAAPEGANLLLGDTADRSASVRVAFADLRARYEWSLYDARVEAAPGDNPTRRRFKPQP